MPGLARTSTKLCYKCNEVWHARLWLAKVLRTKESAFLTVWDQIKRKIASASCKEYFPDSIIGTVRRIVVGGTGIYRGAIGEVKRGSIQLRARN